MERSVALLAEKVRLLDSPEPILSLCAETNNPDDRRAWRYCRYAEAFGNFASLCKRNRHHKPSPTRAARLGATDQRADILVLGDSFFNIFSLAEMGWGASAGFVEQLSYTLGRPLDAILRNDAGAFATRELLGQELARGRDRLDAKKLVIWEFAVRELGDRQLGLRAHESSGASAKGFPGTGVW